MSPLKRLGRWVNLWVDSLIWGRIDALPVVRCEICGHPGEEQTVLAGKPPVPVRMRVCSYCTGKLSLVTSHV